MIKTGKVAFKDTDSLNVTANPLPNYIGSKINVISEKKRFVVQRDVILEPEFQV